MFTKKTTVKDFVLQIP